MYTYGMPKKILIIDDDYNIDKKSREELLKAGYETVVAYSAKEGITISQKTFQQKFT